MEVWINMQFLLLSPGNVDTKNVHVDLVDEILKP